MFHSHSDKIADQTDGMLRFVLFFSICYDSLMELFADGVEKIFINGAVRKIKQNRKRKIVSLHVDVQCMIILVRIL